MIALDTHILVHAQRKETDHHPQALKLITGLAEGRDPWGLPWPCGSGIRFWKPDSTSRDGDIAGRPRGIEVLLSNVLVPLQVYPCRMNAKPGAQSGEHCNIAWRRTS